MFHYIELSQGSMAHVVSMLCIATSDARINRGMQFTADLPPVSNRILSLSPRTLCRHLLYVLPP